MTRKVKKKKNKQTLKESFEPMKKKSEVYEDFAELALEEKKWHLLFMSWVLRW